jgi:hypothetical protein
VALRGCLPLTAQYPHITHKSRTKYGEHIHTETPCLKKANGTWEQLAPARVLQKVRWPDSCHRAAPVQQYHCRHSITGQVLAQLACAGMVSMTRSGRTIAFSAAG